MKIFAGMDLGGTDIKFGAIDRKGRILYYKSVPSHANQGRKVLLDRLCGCGHDLIEFARSEKHHFDYIGLGSPGTVDCDRGRILGHSPNIPGWQGTDVAGYLSGKLGKPVYVGNDANMMALAETVYGAAHGALNVLCTTIGTGIGGGVIINGKLVIGTGYGAGEFGHIPIIKDGKSCKCGFYGCLEAYAASENLLAIARRILSDFRKTSALKKIYIKNKMITIKEILKHYKKDDIAALEIMRIQADYMAAGFAAVVHLLNPEVIVIGGGIADGGGVKYIRLLKQLLKERIFPDSYRNLRVVKARLGNKAGFIGAAIQKEKIN